MRRDLLSRVKRLGTRQHSVAKLSALQLGEDFSRRVGLTDILYQAK